MSKPSLTSTPKTTSQLPSQSAWSKGPPQNNPSRSQSPAPAHFSHSRRPSGLSQPATVPSKDAFSQRINPISQLKTTAVTFGSIDDTPPLAAPTAKQAFIPNSSSTTVQLPPSQPQPRLPSTAASHVNGKPSAPSSSPSPAIKPAGALPSAQASSATSISSSTPSSTAAHKINRADIAKMFQGGGSSSVSSSTTPSDTASPSVRPATLPAQLPSHQQPQQPQPPPPPQYPQGQPIPPPSQQGAHYQPFVPGATALRPQQQNGPGVGSGPVPRSPQGFRQMPNGTPGSRPPASAGGAPPQMQPGLASPRLSTHPHPGPPAGMPPPPQPIMPSWQYYNMQPYAGMPPESYVAYGQWFMPTPHPVPHQTQHQHQPHHPPPSGPPGQPHPMPMSPRLPPPQQLPVPGTPTQTQAVLGPQHVPLPHSASNANLSSLPSPSPTQSVVVVGGPPGGGVGLGPPSATQGTGRLNRDAGAFVPGRFTSKVTIKSQDGTELDLGSLAKPGTGPSVQQSKQQPSVSRRPASVVRMESEQEKKLREENARKEAEEKSRKEKEEQAKKEEERRKKEEEERRKEEEKENERLRKEEEEKKERERREEEERERKRKEELERQERLRKEEEDKERLRQELERKQREEEEEKERVRKEEEDKERLRLEEERLRAEEKAKAEAEAEAAAAAAAQAEAEAAAKVDIEAEAELETGTSTPQEAEEGEIVDETPADQANDSSHTVIDHKLRDRESLRIDTAPVKAPSDFPRKIRPAQLDLSAMPKNGSIPPALPSALATARNINDLARVPYPEGVLSPKVELNINAKDGKFRYDREFLLQFMSICKEKPDMLPPLDAIGLEPSDQTYSMIRGGSGRHRQASGPAPSSSSRSSVGLGISTNAGFNKTGPPNSFMMGNFATHGSKLSSEERFSMSTTGRVASGPSSLSYARPIPVMRSSSQGGPGSTPGTSMGSNRTRSKRGEKRNDGNKAQGGGQQGYVSAFGPAVNAVMEPEPLTLSGNRWVPVTLARRGPSGDPDSPEMVDRKVKGLLNKLTMERFDSISDQIIAWANKSEKEKDGRTLIQVIRLVFEKATDEATWSEMYARLCRKMMEQISSGVQDDGIKNSEGKPITGGQLFRKYLLNRCQEDFERGWVAKETTAAAAASKAKEDEAVKASNETRSGEEEVALYSDEYYAAQKAKRQGLGLIKFIGELFKLQMLTERIMHECVKKLLGNVQNPEEEEIESLCKLLATVGQILDTSKARAHMDVYFSRMKELVKSTSVTARMQFMLQDVIELRERKWISRNAVAAPSTIAQVHEAAAKEKAAQEKEAYQRQMSMSRGGSRRGGDRGGDFQQVGPDGWAVAGSSGPARPPPKAGDLSNFGKITKSTTLSFGPSSVFAGKKENKRDAPLSRTNSSSNIYHLLSEGNTEASPLSKPNHVPRKASVDLPPPEPQRRRLVLQPRTKPLDDPTPAAAPATPSSDSNSSEDEAPVEPTMSEKDAMKKIDEDIKEFFAVRNLEEAEEYVTSLPSEHRWRLLDKLVSRAIESKQADAQLVADFFENAAAKGLCTPQMFEDGFMPAAEQLDDIAIDVPRAFPLMALMMKGAGLDEDEPRRTNIVSKVMDGDQLLALLS